MLTCSMISESTVMPASIFFMHLSDGYMMQGGTAISSLIASMHMVDAHTRA